MILCNQNDTSINSVDVSISTECYENKNENWKTVKYERSRITTDELADKLRQGYCVCHCFKTSRPTFGVSEKANKNFEKADVVFVDVDDCDIEMNDFVQRLSKKPTLYYTTPSNQTAKSGYQYRFRMAYQFAEPITDVGEYKCIYQSIMRSIGTDIPTFKNKDDCGGVASQQFGGNGKEDCDMKITHNVFSFSDFPFETDIASSLFLLSFLNGKQEHKTDNKPHTEVDVTDKEFINDMEKLQPTDLIQKYKSHYMFFDSSPLTYEDGYAVIPEDYRQICRMWYVDTFEKDNGTTVKFTRIKKIRNGERRRQKLYYGALIRKQILPTITFEHLMYNLIYEREYFFDNSDKAITNKVLASIAKQVVSVPLEQITIKSEPRRKRKFAVDKAFCNEHGIKPNAYKNVVKKKLKDEEIGSAYDCSKSVAENLAMFQTMGIKVGKSKLYDWCKENDISTKPQKKSEPHRTNPNAMTVSCVNGGFVSI